MPTDAAAMPAMHLSGGMRVLLVEDDHLVAELMHELLTEAGYEVVTQNTAQAALDAIEDPVQVFDAVICDYRLPNSSGLKVAGMARRRWPDIRAIILTGDMFDPELRNLADRGITVLRKPVTNQVLAAALTTPTPKADSVRGAG